jgi:hypothetical protein
MTDGQVKIIVVVIVICGWLCINGLAAMEFEAIANMKGHHGYWGWCFWLGFIGYFMVIALPDRSERNTLQLSNEHQEELPDL